MSTKAMVYRPASDLVMRRVGREAVVVPVRNRVGDLDSVFTLNEVACRVWELLDGSTPVESIVTAICGEFDVEPDVASTDVADLMRNLEEAQLVQRVEA